MTCDTFWDGLGLPPTGACVAHAAVLVRDLRLGGCWKASIKRREIAAFAHWAERRGLAPTELNDAHVVEYLACAPAVSKAALPRRRAAVEIFLQYLRTVGVSPADSPPADATPTGVLVRRYAEYLRRERGLTERSIAVYLPYVCAFVRETLDSGPAVVPRDLDADVVRSSFVKRVRGRPAAYARLVAAAWRSFLRFLFLRSGTPTDLSRTIPRVMHWRQAGVCLFLTPPEVRRILGAVDRTTPGGRRDYAILLLLARLYVHADMRLKERALGRATASGRPPTRYRPPDRLLAFLESI